MSRRLKLLTHNSIHLITPFDSGGSSAKLRQAFGMPSVGDLRNRLMALADETTRGSPDTYRLFALRLPLRAEPEELRSTLNELHAGDHPFISTVPDPMQGLIREELRFLSVNLPPDFDLRGASIGNLMLAGSYLRNGRDLDAVARLYSRLAMVRGEVRSICDADLQLAAELQDGSKIIGQHLLTGKAHPPIQHPITKLYLVESAEKSEPVKIAATPHCLEMIAAADLICFPMGSFYSSVIANLLPMGVGKAIAAADCPKVFVPNTGMDPEMLGLSTLAAVETLIRYLREDAGTETPVERILSAVLLAKDGDYPVAADRAGITSLGLQVVELDLASEEEAEELDGEKLAQALISMA